MVPVALFGPTRGEGAAKTVVERAVVKAGGSVDNPLASLLTTPSDVISSFPNREDLAGTHTHTYTQTQTMLPRFRDRCVATAWYDIRTRFCGTYSGRPADAAECAMALYTAFRASRANGGIESVDAEAHHRAAVRVVGLRVRDALLKGRVAGGDERM